MKVFSIVGSKKLREDIAPKIIKELESQGHTVGYIKKTDHISSNSITKKAIIWGEHQSLYYHEGEQTLHDLLIQFDEDYVIIDNDEKSNIPKLLMFEEVNIENTTDVADLGAMNNLKRREDIFFTAEADTEFSEIIEAVKEKVFEVLPDFEPDCCDLCGKSCRELNEAIIKGEALREDCKIDDEPIELRVGDEKLTMVPFVKNILRNSVEAVASELDGYKEDLDLEVRIKK